MKAARNLSIAGVIALGTLAGCGRSMMQYGERASWRHEAEVACLKSGAVKIGGGVVQIQPIEGPGVCGADFPLKVAALGESNGAIGYLDDPRPPGAIPNAGGQMPNWPVNDQRYAPPAAVPQNYSQPRYTQPVQSQPIDAPAAGGERMRWMPGPQGVQREPDEPMSLAPPATSQPQYRQPEYQQPQMQPRAMAPQPQQPVATYAQPQADDIPDDAILPTGRRGPQTQPAYNAPAYQPQPQRYEPPALGPQRGPMNVAAAMPAVVKPTATLACPMVSALDRWVTEGVQPAALRWFRSQVVEIKQISAYSCRNMVGEATAHMSEHAYGNALDVAAFTLADGRKVTVQDGWHGSPEEQGFLHDIQLSACDMFTTVLAPGYNVYHYNHIHVDLMRRASGRHPCRPDAIPGEVAAAKARSMYAAKQHHPAYTGSVPEKTPAGSTVAVPGEDGYVPDDDEVTGSITKKPAPVPHNVVTPGEDGEFYEDDMIVSAPRFPRAAAPAIPNQDRFSSH